MAEADPTELAAFLRTVKGQFQESPGRLATKLAHICETLRNSGQEDQPTYRLVASALRTVVIIGKIDPRSLPAGSSMRELTEDGPVFIPDFVQLEAFPQPANNPPVTPPASFVGASGSFSASQAQDLFLHNRLASLQRDLARFTNQFSASMPAGQINQHKQAGPGLNGRQTRDPDSPVASRDVLKLPEQASSHLEPFQANLAPTPFSRGDLYMQPDLNTALRFGSDQFLQAQAAALMSQQAFLHGQSKGIPHFRPDLSGAQTQFSNFSPSQQQTPFYGMDGFLQQSSFFQQPAARGHYPSGNQEAVPKSGLVSLDLPQTIPGPSIHSTVPISPHELPRPAPLANEQQSRGLNSSWFAPPSSRSFRPFLQTPGNASSEQPASAIGSLPGPYLGSHSSTLPSNTAYQVPSRVQQSDQASGERHSNGTPVPRSGSRPSTQPRQQGDGERQWTELSRSGPLQSSSQAGQGSSYTGSQKEAVDQSASRLQPVSGSAQTPLGSAPASGEGKIRASSVEESVRRGVHQRADAVLANGGDTNAELQRVAETVKELARVGQAPACFLSEQKRQLVAQINIFHNFKHGKPANQATIGLALEDLKKLLSKHSGVQGSVSKTGGRPGGGVKAPGKRPKRQLTEEEKEREREKNRVKQRLRRMRKLAEKQKHPLGYGSFWDEAKSAAPSAEAVNLVNTAKEAALQQKRSAAPAAPSSKPASGQPSTKPDRLAGQQDSSQLPKSGSSRPEPSSIAALPGSASQQSQPSEPSKGPQKSARSETLKPPAARQTPDTRKPQVVDGWLAAEKAKSIAEAGNWSHLYAKLDQHVVSKFAELRHAAALPTQDELKTKNVVEVKKLELLAVQKRLRREVMDEFFDPAQAELQNVRQVKLKKSLKRLRELERREQKQRDERARREKERIRNSMKSLEQHKAVLTEVQKAKKDRVLRNNRLVIEFHKRKERAEREKKERLQREKIQALKSNDVEGYMKLVQDAKSDRVQQLLKETESYLHKLGEKLATVTRKARDAAQGEGLTAAEPVVVDTTGAALPSLLESNEKYYTLAHAVKEAVVTQPKMLVGGQLREYQMKGLQWMVSLYNNKLNGILADEMGLGKTIQVIALLCYLMETKREAGPFLIVVPSSVFSNWVSEIKRWAPSATTVPYRGNPDTRRRIYSEQMAGGKFDILVTTYEFLMNKHDRPRLSKIKWAHLIIDEGHRIKNANCKLNTDLKQYSAKNRLLLTGTPIQNNLDELWTLLNFLLPDIFNSSDDFRQWFNKPFEGSGVEDTEDQALLNEEENLLVINRLHQVLRPFMLRRMKEKVADELPSKVERLVRCEASAYQKLLARQVTEKLGRLAGQTKGKAVQNTVMELRNICNHPYLSLLHVEDVEYGLDEHFLSTAVRLCGKLEMLDRILPKLKAGGHKILFFCTMTRLLDIMEDYLLEKGYGYLRLDGGTSGADRGSLIEEFNAPDSRAFIFLLSLRAGGIGINLQSADTVIIYDTDWNPQVDLQAQARAHRIGQKKEVLVLRLETVNTVEEKIRARAEHKMGVATQSITAGFFDQSTSAEDRRDFLEAILREANADRAESMDVPDDDQLNELLSRTPEELGLFAAEDRRRRQEDEMRWRSIKGSQAVPAVLPRLITDAELQPVLKELERTNLEQSRSGSLDVSEELGRGRRIRESKRDGYTDLTERQFNYLLREGNLPPSAFKKQGRENGAEEPQPLGPKKRRKKEQKPSEELVLREAQLPVDRVGEMTVGPGYKMEKQVGEGHVAPAPERHLTPPSIAVWQKNGPLRAGTEQDGPGVGYIRPQVLPGVAIVRAPAVSSPMAPGVLPIAGGCEQTGTDVKQSGKQVPPAQNKRPATASPPAADESDEDLPLCALRPPPSKKPKRSDATQPPSKSPQSVPPPSPAGALALPSPTKGGLSGGVSRQLPPAASGGATESMQSVKVPVSANGPSSQLPVQIGGGAPSASNGALLPEDGPTPPGLSFVNSSSQEHVQLLGSGISPGTGLGSVGVEPTQVSKQGGITEAAPAVGCESSAKSGASMFGTMAGDVTARQLGLPGEPRSPPERVHSSEAFPKLEVRNSSAGGQRPLAELRLAANAASPSSPDCAGVLTGVAEKPPDSSKPASVVEQSIDSQETRSQNLHEAVSKPGQVSLADMSQLDAMHAPKGYSTDESALKSNGLTAEASAGLSKPVLRKGLKRRRALCWTAEEAFEWSEEDVEEPDVRKEHVGSPSGSPPVAHEADVSSPSGMETDANGLAAGIGNASNGRPRSSARNSAPEVMGVSADAGGPLQNRDSEKQGRFDKKSALLANGPEEVSCGEEGGWRGDGNSNGAPNMVRASPTFLQSSVIEHPGVHKAPISSTPTRGQKAGGFASPHVPSGRAYSLSPGLRVDGGSGSGTPDSVVSEASLRAAHSVVGNLVDSMSVDGITPCKITYSRAL